MCWRGAAPKKIFSHETFVFFPKLNVNRQKVVRLPECTQSSTQVYVDPLRVAEENDSSETTKKVFDADLCGTIVGRVRGFAIKMNCNTAESKQAY